MVERATAEIAAKEGLTKRDLENREIARRAIAKVQCGKGAKASSEFLLHLSTVTPCCGGALGSWSRALS